MRRLIQVISWLILGTVTPALAQNISAPSEVHVAVDVIPATARYMLFARLNPAHPTIDESEAAGTGANLAKVVDALSRMAEQRGANLVVLLGSDRGIPVPISQANAFIMLRPNNPVVTALLLHYDDTRQITPAEQRVRMTTQPPPHDKDLPGNGQVKKVQISIPLQYMTPGLSLDQWVYMNMPRFYAIAAKMDFDTISILSTRDSAFQQVWLPHCDDPLKVSRASPRLDVTIYRAPTAVR